MARDEKMPFQTFFTQPKMCWLEKEMSYEYEIRKEILGYLFGRKQRGKNEE